MAISQSNAEPRRPINQAVLAEAHGIRTTWHGPADVSSVGHQANLHLDLVHPKLGFRNTQASMRRPEKY